MLEMYLKYKTDSNIENLLSYQKASHTRTQGKESVSLLRFKYLISFKNNWTFIK